MAHNDGCASPDTLQIEGEGGGQGKADRVHHGRRCEAVSAIAAFTAVEREVGGGFGEAEV